MKARELDKRFDAGEDVSRRIDWSKTRRPNEKANSVSETKSTPAAKATAAVETKAEPKAEAKAETTAAPKAEAGAAAKPSAAAKVEPKAGVDRGSRGHSAGEGQKVVTQKYRQNWDAIFGKKR